MSNVFQAVLCSARHPEDGKATVSFPIPREEYDHTLELLSGMGFGSIDYQDCLVTALDSPYAALKGLIGTDVNVDELDCLAKRLEGFHEDEGAQFQGMAYRLDLRNIRDFINLAFCCQKGGQASLNGGVKLKELYTALPKHAEPMRIGAYWQKSSCRFRTPAGHVPSSFGNTTSLERNYPLAWVNGLRWKEKLKSGSIHWRRRMNAC